MLRPHVVRATSAMAVEIGWVSAHLAIYPLGLLRDRGDDPDPARFRFGDLPLAQRGLIGADVEAATTPIVLIHGIVDNRTIFAMMRSGLRVAASAASGRSPTARTPTTCATTAERFGAFIEDLVEETGSDRVHVIGHSLGGLIARYYVQRLGGDAGSQTLVTLGRRTRARWRRDCSHTDWFASCGPAATSSKSWPSRHVHDPDPGVLQRRRPA